MVKVLCVERLDQLKLASESTKKKLLFVDL